MRGRPFSFGRKYLNSTACAAVLVCRWGASGLTSGEEGEFTAMVLRQTRFVFRVAYAVLLNAHDAEDAAQETFLKLYRNGGWRGMENERAFLARAAWRVAQDRRTSFAGAAMRGSGTPASADESEQLASLAPSPEQVTVDGDHERMIHRMIDGLPEELRLPLVLSAFEELNSRAVGDVLGIPEGTVRTRLQRARQLLRQKMGALNIRRENMRREETPYAR